MIFSSIATSSPCTTHCMDCLVHVQLTVWTSNHIDMPPVNVMYLKNRDIDHLAASSTVLILLYLGQCSLLYAYFQCDITYLDVADTPNLIPCNHPYTHLYFHLYPHLIHYYYTKQNQEGRYTSRKKTNQKTVQDSFYLIQLVWIYIFFIVCILHFVLWDSYVPFFLSVQLMLLSNIMCFSHSF